MTLKCLESVKTFNVTGVYAVGISTGREDVPSME